MRRGTTPTHNFTLPFSVPEGSCIRIVYSQNNHIIVEKTTEDCTISDKRVTVRLTDRETLRFDCTPHYHNGRLEPYPVEIQIGVKTAHGDKLWSEIITDNPKRCLRNDGVI